MLQRSQGLRAGSWLPLPPSDLLFVTFAQPALECRIHIPVNCSLYHPAFAFLWLTLPDDWCWLRVSLRTKHGTPSCLAKLEKEKNGCAAKVEFIYGNARARIEETHIHFSNVPYYCSFRHGLITAVYSVF